MSGAVSLDAGSPIGLMLGADVLIVGVERDPVEPEILRVYVGARYQHIYFELTDPDDIAETERAWRLSYNGHLHMARASLPPLLQAATDNTPTPRAEGREAA